MDSTLDQLPDDHAFEGLVHAASVLEKRGRRNSSINLARDLVKLTSLPSHLNKCLDIAQQLKNVDIIDECIAHSSSTLDREQERDFMKRARQARFAILANEHLDMRTPFRELIDRKGFGDAQVIVYADIDLNTVDGSAVWMASVSKILSQGWKTIVISKNPILRDAIVRDLIVSEQVLFVTPGNTAFDTKSLVVEQAVSLIKELDDCLPQLSAVIVRGLSAVEKIMSDRQFWRRLYAYLTDLYTHTDEGITIRPEAQQVVDMVTRQGAGFLVQTPQIGALIENMAPFRPTLIDLPPPVPDGLIDHHAQVERLDVIRIGYAGKIAPIWGIQQLCAWVAQLRKEGLNIELTIIGDKVSGAGTAEQNRTFRGQIAAMLSDVDARQLGAMARNEVMAKMQTMHFAWCWRPPEFENHTLELSSKMVESVISGIPSIVYPSPVNRDALGDEYSFFAKEIADFRDIILSTDRAVSRSVRVRLNARHSFANQAENLSKALDVNFRRSEPRMLLAAHDPKFIHPYVSDLKRRGYPVNSEKWQWGGKGPAFGTTAPLTQGDMVFCEWGLANAVWYSNNKRPGTKLYVRVHRQEIAPRAAKFGHRINKDAVDCFIFVEENVRRKAIDLFGIPESKTCLIQNFLLDDEYRNFSAEKHASDVIALGMVGIVPQLKRFDRAVSLLKSLIERGEDARLKIKGPRPEEMAYMHAPGRVEELAYYDAIYREIEQDPKLNGKVEFSGWSNNVADWYRNIDFILSPSDFESFHYALADGILAGCTPVIWSRNGAGKIYNDDWLIANEQEAVSLIKETRRSSQEQRMQEARAKRALLVERYGSERIFKKLDQILYDGDGNTTASRNLSEVDSTEGRGLAETMK